MGPGLNFRWLQMNISEISVGMEVESERETTRTKVSPEEISLARVLVAPTLGLTLQGSVYHPNFL